MQLTYLLFILPYIHHWKTCISNNSINVNMTSIYRHSANRLLPTSTVMHNNVSNFRANRH